MPAARCAEEYPALDVRLGGEIRDPIDHVMSIPTSKVVLTTWFKQEHLNSIIVPSLSMFLFECFISSPRE